MKKIFLLIVLNFAIASYAKVVIFPKTEGINPSIYYSVKVNGQEVFVYDSPIVSYTVFDFDEEVSIEIKALSRDVKWVDVRPLSKKVNASFGNDSTIRFNLKNPCDLSIELNGEADNFPLFLFSNYPEKDKPQKNTPNVLFFEAGKFHKAGMIELKSNQTLYIEGGAVVDGIVVSNNTDHVKIKGRGIMLGSNSRRVYSEEWRHFFNFHDCRNLEMSDILIIDSHSWCVAPFNCENLYFHGVRIVSDNGGDDGMDIMRCRNVKIDNCFYRTKDDNIAIKSAGKYPSHLNTNNIKISNCTFWNAAWGNAFEIGFELRSDSVKNISLSNCDVIHVEDGAVFSIHNADRSIVDNVLIENIRIEDATQKLFDLAIFISRYSSDGEQYVAEEKTRYWHGIWDNVWHLTPSEKIKHASGRGVIQNVIFRNIDLVEGRIPFSVICGYDNEHKISNIVFENIKFYGKKVTSTQGLRLYSEFSEDIVVK